MSKAYSIGDWSLYSNKMYCRGSCVGSLLSFWFKHNFRDGVMATGDCWSILYLQLRQRRYRNYQWDIGNCHWSDCRHNVHVQRHGSRTKCHWKQRRLYSHYVYVAIKRFFSFLSNVVQTESINDNSCCAVLNYFGATENAGVENAIRAT